MGVRKLGYVVLLASLAVTQMSLAAGNRSRNALVHSQKSYVPYKEELAVPNRLQVDLGPLLNSGVGLSYERTVDSQFTVGPFASYSTLKMKPQSASVTLPSGSFDSTVIQYGLKGRFFFDAADVSSFYLVAGAASVSANTKVNTSLASSQSKATAIGASGGAGYQWIFGGFTEGTRSLINLAGTYGTGNTVTSQLWTLGPIAVLGESKIKSAFALELNLGFMF